MANVAHPGFAPVMKGNQTVELTRKRVLTNNTTAIFKGDAVVNATTGDVAVTTATTTSAYSVQWGGASYLNSGGDRIERKYLPAATTYTSTTVDPYNASYVYIVDDMVSTKFRASIPGATVLDRAGENYKMVLGAGSTSSGLSGHSLDSATPATTATFPWRMMEHVIGDPKCDPDGSTNVHVICMLNAGSREPALEIGGSLGT